ncbi:hypothetical protein DFJ77DRAFT_189665 [Powellomyces hirtus]|nr:hypothetical protein DFJ77DRAFT_189665 [Powellomyces hirtus]
MLSQPIEVPHTGEDRVTSALSRQLQKLELKPQPISHPLEICAPQNSEQIPPNHRYHLPAISTQPLSIPQFSAPPSARRIDGEPYPPQSAIPHSPPKDIGDGILARRAYNNNNVTASPLPVPVPVVLQEKQPANRQNQHHTDESPLSPNSEKEEQQRLRAPKLSRITKYNSCSTLFVESTISNSDLTDTLRCVASALVNHMKNPPSRHEGLPDILSEELHPLSNHIRFHRRKPREDDVFRFLECLFNAAELTAECGIITLIYIERLLKNAQLHITAGNWTRIVLGALLLASKVWDDHAVWNVDFVQIFPDVAVDDMNDLERYYIATLEFNVNIKSSEYAKYYFSLRELTENSNRQSDEERKPLTTRDVGLLDARQPRPTTPIPLQPLSSSGTAPLLLPLSHAAAPTRSFSPSYKASPTPSNKSGLNTSLTPRGLNDAAAAAAALPRNALAGSLRRSASDYIFVPSKPFATIL